jgi:acetyl-CoA carboxylase biotin carboxyl carrier protein
VVAEEREPGPFNVDTIHKLVRLMARHDLNEILLEQGDTRIRLRRGVNDAVLTTSPTIVPAAHPVSHTHAPSPAPAAAAGAPAAPAKALHEIKSPMVGTFYKAEKADAPPYVKVGSKVTPTTVVCLIEAMKLYNEIQAECTGAIVEVCVENAQAVEFGTVLFRVDPAG